MKKKIFIDGEEGTTGLQIYKKLSIHPEIEVIKIDKKFRKDLEKRRRMMEFSDVTFLCLPDQAAKEAVKICNGLGYKSPILIDASSAHRICKDWVYGLPELSSKQRINISIAKRISVPGCYATGATVLLSPLLKGSILDKSTKFIIQAISGYSGGGKKLINHFNQNDSEPFFYYGLNLNHKHLPEITHHNDLKNTPIFIPSVANFYQGMIVNLPLHIEYLKKAYTFEDVINVITDKYSNSQFVKVEQYHSSFSEDGFYRPDKVINTNNIYISFFVNKVTKQMVISSNFDNLGKGASSAAIQCMNIALGFDESLSLI